MLSKFQDDHDVLVPSESDVAIADGNSEADIAGHNTDCEEESTLASCGPPRVRPPRSNLAATKKNIKNLMKMASSQKRKIL